MLLEETWEISFFDAIDNPMRDPAFTFVILLSQQFGGIYFVNLISGTLFSLGLISFCNQLPRPWLALTVATPYLIIVVAMGYTRQAVAIGLCMWAISFLFRGKRLVFVSLVFAAAAFHKSAVIFIVFGFLLTRTRNLAGIFLFIIISSTFYFLFLSDALGDLIKNYFIYNYESSGAFIRLFMNAVPGILFLILHRKFCLTEVQRIVWKSFSYAAITLLILYFLIPSSTGLDRIGLYLLPLQVFFWSHFPDAFNIPGRRGLLAVSLVIGAYFIVLLVWLFFAAYSVGWIPYRFYPFTLF